jgi:hypothetical protein
MKTTVEVEPRWQDGRVSYPSPNLWSFEMFKNLSLICAGLILSLVCLSVADIRADGKKPQPPNVNKGPIVPIEKHDLAAVGLITNLELPNDLEQGGTKKSLLATVKNVGKGAYYATSGKRTATIYHKPFFPQNAQWSPVYSQPVPTLAPGASWSFKTPGNVTGSIKLVISSGDDFPHNDTYVPPVAKVMK